MQQIMCAVLCMFRVKVFIVKTMTMQPLQLYKHCSHFACFLVFGNPFSYLSTADSPVTIGYVWRRRSTRPRADAIKVCLHLKGTDRPRWPSETRRPAFAPGITLAHQSPARQTHSNTTSCADGRGGPVHFGFRGSTVWPSLRPSGVC